MLKAGVFPANLRSALSSVVRSEYAKQCDQQACGFRLALLARVITHIIQLGNESTASRSDK